MKKMTLASLLTIALVVLQSYSVFGRSLLQSSVTVSNTAELREALSGTATEIIVSKSFRLTSSLPIITKEVTVRGDATSCLDQGVKNGTSGFCAIDGRYKRRHFTVGEGGMLILKDYLELRTGKDVKGGSVYVTNGGHLHAYSVAFSFNFASGVTYGGGAVAADNGSMLEFESTIFSRNTAGFGGAIDVSGGATAMITDSQFRRNSAGVAGGAVNFVGKSAGVISGGSFFNNTAQIGGSVHVRVANVSICNSASSKNEAVSLGPDLVANKGSQLNYCFNSSTVTSSPSVVAVLGGTTAQVCAC